MANDCLDGLRGTLRWVESGNRSVTLQTNEVSPGLFEGENWPGNAGNIFGDFPFRVTFTESEVNIDSSWNCTVGDETLVGNAPFESEGRIDRRNMAFNWPRR